MPVRVDHLLEDLTRGVGGVAQAHAGTVNTAMQIIVPIFWMMVFFYAVDRWWG